MSFSLGSTFDARTPSLNYDALQTFDGSVEGDDTISTPFATIMADRLPAIAFTQKLFELRPDLFGAYAMSLVYAQHSGTAYKPEVIYSMFEQYIKYGPKQVITSLNTRQVGTYELCPNYIILWAKLLRQTRMTIGFEPVMSKLNNTLNAFFANKKINIKGINYDIAIFKPLCYTRAGECFFTILPYICYLITFLCDCRPYTFNEATTESSTFGFYNSLEQHFQKYYTAMNEDTGVNLPKTNPRAIPAKVTDAMIADMLKKMLHPDRIIEVRNAEISKTPSLLNECIHDQAQLSDAYVEQAFTTTMNRLIKIIIHQFPLKYIFDAIPQFRNDSSNLNMNELMNWTNYCLAGGNKPFCIESGIHTNKKALLQNYTNIRHCESIKLVSYPAELVGKQELKSNINPINIAKGQPFCENDVVLNMGTAYVRKRFDAKRNDILDDDPIAINETMLWHENTFKQPIGALLRNLFLNGIWAYENSTMIQAFKILYSIPEFVSEVNDLIALGNVTEIAYSNHLGSTVIAAYLLSYLNLMVITAMANGYDLKYIRPYRFLVRSEVDRGRIAKLCDMATSLLYISHPKYAGFVNAVTRDFVELMEKSPVIQQPYVKRLADFADIYAIGGCELYRWATHVNPLVRGCMWYYNVFGWSEDLENFFLWIQALDNSALMELLESSVNDTALMESTIKIQLMKVKDMKKHPLIHANYEFDEKLSYRERSHIYVLDPKINNKGVVGTITRYIFKRTAAASATMESIMFKRIMYQAGEVIARKAQKNSVDIADKIHAANISDLGIGIMAPIYDVLGKVDEVKVINHTPSGYRIEQLILGNSRNPANQVILIYTKQPLRTRFSSYVETPTKSIPTKDGNVKVVAIPAIPQKQVAPAKQVIPPPTPAKVAISSSVIANAAANKPPVVTAKTPVVVAPPATPMVVAKPAGK